MADADMERSTEQNEKRKRRGAFAYLKSGTQRLTLGLGSSALVLITATAIALVAIASLAWLAKNRDVDSGSMAMDIGSDVFELGRVAAPTLPTPVMDAMTNAQNRAYSSDSITSDGGAGVVCALTLDDPNLRSIGPGATGTLTFKIYPKQTGRTYEATLGLSAVGKTSTANVYEFLSDETEFAPGDARAAAFNYLKGHVLFFASRSDDDDDGVYSYGDRIAPGGSFRITGASSTTQPAGYTVTVFWEWPNDYNRLKTLFGVTEIADEDPPIYFKNGVAGNGGYNEADDEIGFYISYFAPELRIKVAAAENEGTLPEVGAN